MTATTRTTNNLSTNQINENYADLEKDIKISSCIFAFNVILTASLGACFAWKIWTNESFSDEEKKYSQIALGAIGFNLIGNFVATKINQEDQAKLKT